MEKAILHRNLAICQIQSDETPQSKEEKSGNIELFFISIFTNFFFHTFACIRRAQLRLFSRSDHFSSSIQTEMYETLDFKSDFQPGDEKENRHGGENDDEAALRGKLTDLK